MSCEAIECCLGLIEPQKGDVAEECCAENADEKCDAELLPPTLSLVLSPMGHGWGLTSANFGFVAFAGEQGYELGGVLSLNFYGVACYGTTGAAAGFESFGQCGKCLGIVGEAADDGDGFTFATFAGDLYAQVLLVWGEVRYGTLCGFIGGATGCVKFRIDHSIGGFVTGFAAGALAFCHLKKKLF